MGEDMTTDLRDMLNRVVTLTGTADNAHSGAVVVGDNDAWMVYIDGLRWWDTPEYRKTVEVTGLLVVAKLAPDPVVQDGVHSHGASGSSLVLRDASWRVLS